MHTGTGRTSTVPNTPSLGILCFFLEPARRSPAALMYAISKLSYWYLLYHGNPHVACSGERSAQPQQVAKAAPTAAEDSYNQLT